MKARLKKKKLRRLKLEKKEQQKQLEYQKNRPDKVYNEVLEILKQK